MTTDKEIRQALKDRGADIVRKRADGAWDALWYEHPHNIASNGHFCFAGWDNTDAAKNLHIDY